MKKAAVISGGGAWGAYGAGFFTGKNEDYDIVIGISTGALMAPLIALKEYEKLRVGYTSVSDKDIFDKTPFKSDGSIKTTAIIKALYKLILGHRSLSLATTGKMRETIKRFVQPWVYNRIRKEGKHVIVGAQNLNEYPSLLHYFNILAWDYEDFIDWMWASANAPVVTTLLEKEYKGKMGAWTDGGVSELVDAGIYKALKMGADKVDVFVHRTENVERKVEPVDNIVTNFLRVFDGMRHDIEREDLTRIKDERVNVYYLPYQLSSNSLVFDKRKMNEWYQIGMRHGQRSRN